MKIKKKITELAKEFNIVGKEMLTYVKKAGIGQKSSSSSLDENELNLTIDFLLADNQVENFEMYAVKERAEAEPTPESAEKKKEDEKAVAEAIAKPIEKKVRYVDTRQNVVDQSRLDDTKIEKIMQGTDIYGTATSKQKIKKTGRNQRFDKTGNRWNRFEKHKPMVIKPEIIRVKIPEEISVGELAERLKKSASDVIKKLMAFGTMASVSQSIDHDTAAVIALEFGAEVEKIVTVTLEDELFTETPDTEEQLVSRPPVAVVMGHVDHGKTSLLDAIRNADVISTEAGGITQHIGAYKVHVNGGEITFLDTPGHEAFTAMRMRGAQATDIAIIVVAADDGIMPQTIEAINHAKAAEVSIVVAINKMDKEGANPDKVMQSLTEHGLVPEEWGGDIICVPVSAKTKMNLDKLLETVLLISELKELKANPNKPASGIVIEAKLDKSRGPVATVLVQAGTLKTGDIVVAGTSVGKVRAMHDYNGKAQKSAGPSAPVEITGLADVPTAGDIFKVVTDEKKARQVVEQRRFNEKEELFNSRNKVTLDNLFSQISDGQIKDLNIIVKADVQGSVEAVASSLSKISNDEVRVKVIHSGVGTVTESDILLASASNAVIVGFNIRPDAKTFDSAKLNNVDIRLYRVIYQAIEEIEAAMIGMLAPKFRENIFGHAEIRNTFKITGAGTIAGCYVLDGKIVRNSEVRIVRDGVVVFEGALNSLKRFKDDVKEVAQGYECGLGFDKYNDLKVGDVIESFIMEQIEQ